MSGTIQSLQHRIDGAADLEGVVRAMKALAASSIGQYEKAVASLDDYYRTVELGLSVCLREAEPAKAVGTGGPVGAVVFGSDQGLVGRFNEVVADLATGTLKKYPGKVHRFWAVGERVKSLLADAGTAAPEQFNVEQFSVPASVDAITELVGRLLISIESAREKGEVVNVHVFHNRPRSGSAYEPAHRRLLPLDSVWQGRMAKMPWPGKSRPETIGNSAGALSGFIRGYVFMLLFQACAESLNSENASRLAAMQRAEKNIKDILENLNRKFHRVRQASIDEELFDVVSGFEALAGRAR